MTANGPSPASPAQQPIPVPGSNAASGAAEQKWRRFLRSVASRSFWIKRLKSGIKRLKSKALWKGIASVITILIAAVGTWVAIRTLAQGNVLAKENNNLQAAQLDAHLEEVMIGIDNHFVSYPELRPFFFARNGDLMPLRRTVKREAAATAEMIIDFADDVSSYARMGRMKEAAEKKWVRIVRPYFAQSEVTRMVWAEAHRDYGSITACVLGAPAKAEMDKWSWETDSPKPKAKPTCSH